MVQPQFPSRRPHKSRTVSSFFEASTPSKQGRETGRVLAFGAAVVLHSEKELNMESSSKEAVPDWSSIWSMSESSC